MEAAAGKVMKLHVRLFGWWKRFIVNVQVCQFVEKRKDELIFFFFENNYRK